MIDFEKVEDLKPGDIVRTCDIARIAERDMVPAGETMVVESVTRAYIPGYTVVLRPGFGPGLCLTTGRLVPVVRESEAVR